MSRRPVFSIIGLIAYLGVSFAALRTSSPYMASAMVSGTVIALLGSVVATLRPGPRAGWIGFAVFGWGYFLLAFASPFRDVARPHLLTSVAIVESYRRLHPALRVNLTDLAPLPPPGVPVGPTSDTSGGPPQMSAPKFAAVAGGGPRPIIEITWPGAGGAPAPYVPSGPNRFYTFECSAHAAFALLFAGAGALFASLIDRRPNPASKDNPR